MTKVRLIHGDSRIELRALNSESIDACVTDPPYELTSIVKRFGCDKAAACQEGTDGAFARVTRGFMGQTWDGSGIQRDPEFWKLVLRVMKPGAYLLAFGGRRTHHRTVCAIEDAGFEIMDGLAWLFGSGFPKSKNMAMMIDKKLLGTAPRGAAIATASTVHPTSGARLRSGEEMPPYVPISPEAMDWDGWGTAMKPGFEPIVLARRPLSEETIAENILRWGTGGLNIDACRIGSGKDKSFWRSTPNRKPLFGGGLSKEAVPDPSKGRWPANVLLDEDAARMLDDATGELRSGLMAAGTPRRSSHGWAGSMPDVTLNETYGDTGGASRFFYCAKASRRERDAGCDDLPDLPSGVRGTDGNHMTRKDGGAPDVAKNAHPTVKPLALMMYLCKLITPPGGTVLDPFAGSFSTGVAAIRCGFSITAIEAEAAYIPIGQARITEALRARDADIARMAAQMSSLFDESAFAENGCSDEERGGYCCDSDHADDG